MVGIKILKTLKSFWKTLVLSVTCGKCKNKDEKIKEEESVKILKFIVLIKNV